MATFPDESDVRAAPGPLPNGAAPIALSSPASRLPLAGGILLALVAEALLGLALAFFGSGHLLPVKLGVPLISALFALGSCLLVSMALQGRERGAWVLMGLACLGMLVAQGTRFVPLFTGKGFVEDAAAGYPSLASAALIAQSAGFFLAFLLFPPSARGVSLLTRLGQFFDGMLVVGAALVAVIYFVLVPLTQGAKGALTAAQLTTLAICASDLLLLGGMTFALRSVGLRHSPLYGALSILGLAMLLLAAADFLGIIQTPNQLASADSPLQAIWNAGYLTIGLGALLRVRSGNRGASPQGEAAIPEGSPGLWLAFPFVLTVAVAGSIIAQAVTSAATSTEMLVALVCAGALVGLIGIRYLVGLFESRRLAVNQRRALEHHMALAEEQVEQLRSSQLAQARARQESLGYVLDTLMRFGYGDYQARVGALERDLAPLADQLNVFFDAIDRQLNDHDRGRETYLTRILTDALGRLALGELHDLPELPAPGGSPLDGLMMNVVQVRTRLMSLQGAVQQYEQERYAAQQELERAHLELENERQAQQQMVLEMNQTLEGQLHSERQVAQATEEQWQRERQRLHAQAQAAEQRVAEAEARLHAAEQRLVDERLEAEQRLHDERQALEARQQEAARSGPMQLDDARLRGEQLVRQFTGQAERLHAAAATLQTAAEVTQRLARMIRETTALPEMQGASQPAAAAPPPAAPQVVDASPSARSLSALQMLERLAEGRGLDTTPKMPAAAPSAAGAARALTGPLHESPNERVARRLGMAASRAEEISGGLLELAMQCIQAGDESARAAEEAGKLTADLEPPKVPDVIQRAGSAARAPKGRR